MRKKFSVFLACGLVGLSLSSPFASLLSSADEQVMYSHPLICNGYLTGISTRFDDVTVISGYVGTIGSQNSNITHSGNVIDDYNSSSGTMVYETHYNADNSYHLRSENYSWRFVSLSASSVCQSLELNSIYGAFSAPIALTVRASNSVSSMLIQCDTTITIYNLSSGVSQSLLFNNHYYSFNSNSAAEYLLQFDMSKFDLGYQSDMIFVTSQIYLSVVDNSTGLPLYFTWDFRIDSENLLVLNEDIFATYIHDDSKFIGIFGVIFNTIEEFFAIELFPYFHIYDIVAIVLGATLLGFAVKFFLGG